MVVWIAKWPDIWCVDDSDGDDVIDDDGGGADGNGDDERLTCVYNMLSIH